MGNIIKLYEIRKPRIEMLLKNESPAKIKYLKDLAYKVFGEGNLSYRVELSMEFGLRFEDSSLTVEKGEILLIYKEVPYLICKVDQNAA